jgi:bifunctional non-homologous end joining protein LigD
MDNATTGKARGSSMPTWVEPLAATVVQDIPTSPGWVHEIQHHGWRILAFLDGRVRLLSRRNREWTSQLSGIAEALNEIGGEAIIDGGLATPDEVGDTATEAALLELHRNPGSLVYYAFDLLWLQGQDFRLRPLLERKATLELLLMPSLKSGRVLYSNHVSAELGPDLFQSAVARGFEGIVSKRVDAPYRSGLSLDWVKIKAG